MDVDTAVPTAATPISKVPRHDLMMEGGKTRNTFFKQTKSYPMFPCHDDKAKWDDYGEPIRWAKIGGGGGSTENEETWKTLLKTQDPSV